MNVFNENYIILFFSVKYIPKNGCWHYSMLVVHFFWSDGPAVTSLNNLFNILGVNLKVSEQLSPTRSQLLCSSEKFLNKPTALQQWHIGHWGQSILCSFCYIFWTRYWKHCNCPIDFSLKADLEKLKIWIYEMTILPTWQGDEDKCW